MPAPVTIKIHFTAGEPLVIRGDAKKGTANVGDAFNPARVFDREVLTFVGESSLTVVQTANISWIEIDPKPETNWPYLFNAVSINQITQVEFESLRAGIGKRDSDAPREGTYTTLGCMRMIDGATFYLKIETNPVDRTPLDTDVLIRHLMGAHGLYGEQRDGGVVVINPAKIADYVMVPGPQVTPPGSLDGTPILA